MRSRFAGTALGAIAVLAGLVALTCRDPTEITIVVTTDVLCSDRPSAGAIVGSLGELDQRNVFASYTTACGNGELGRLVILPSGDDDGEVAFKIVEGFGAKSATQCVESGDYAECIVARRALRYIAHRPLTVAVALRANCKGVPCDTTSTCVDGRCVPATIPDPTACTDPKGCGDDVLDGSTVACRGAACDSPISAGDGVTCVLRAGAVRCWGENASGQLGRIGTGGPNTTPAAPANVPPTGNRGIVTNRYGTCVHLATGEYSCWGQNTAFGLLGGSADFGTPTTLAFASYGGAKAVIPGNATYAFWIRNDGALAGAGENASGERGVGTQTTEPTGKTVTFPVAGAVKAVAPIGSTFCALLDGGVIACWGANPGGEAEAATAGTPVLSPKVLDLSAFGTPVDLEGCQGNGNFACAILADGSITCWGSGTTPRRVTNAANQPLVGVTDLALGYDFACAVIAGKVQCWGNDQNGALGRGGNPDGGVALDPRAAPVVGLDGVSRIAAGYTHVCALRSNGEVWCWGANVFGGAGGAAIATPVAVTIP